jgi:hypothetical protein
LSPLDWKEAIAIERASEEQPMRVQKIKTVEEIQTGLVQGVRKLSPFLINTAMAPKKGDAKEPSLFRYGIVFLQLENKERKCWVPKGVAFLHGNETHSRVSFYFRPFFVRVVVLKLYTIIT